MKHPRAMKAKMAGSALRVGHFRFHRPVCRAGHLPSKHVGPAHNRQAKSAGLLVSSQFTVRWTGWLVLPVTGHYVLHLTIDDGARLWLDGNQLLDEWRG